MDNKVELSVIIPAYLEEQNLRFLLPNLRQALSKITNSSEILVIDAMGKMDKTDIICLESGAVYINRENGNSYGNAVRTGIKFAGGEHILFMDGDGSHSPEFIRDLYKYKDDFDVVAASRYIQGGSTDNSLMLIVMSRLVNFIYSLVLNIKCKDVSNSFKLYRSDLLKKLDLQCDNFDIVEEILFKLVRENALRIKEVPFSFKERMFGHTKRNLLLFVFSYMFTLLKLRFGNVKRNTTERRTV